MAIELEAKVRVDDLAGIRSRLIDCDARKRSARLERNVYFDTADRSLVSTDKGIRIRSYWPLLDKNQFDSSRAAHVITFKGPQVGLDLKQRQEIEFSVGDADAATTFLAELGLNPVLGFEKRRETWSLDVCTVELDELPILGSFVEVEGESREAVMHVLQRLELGSAPLITTSYIALLDELVRAQGIRESIVRF